MLRVLGVHQLQNDASFALACGQVAAIIVRAIETHHHDE